MDLKEGTYEVTFRRSIRSHRRAIIGGFVRYDIGLALEPRPSPQGQLGGAGVRVDYLHYDHRDCQAQYCGVEVGDILLEIDDESVTHLSVEQICQRLDDDIPLGGRCKILFRHNPTNYPVTKVEIQKTAKDLSSGQLPVAAMPRAISTIENFWSDIMRFDRSKTCQRFYKNFSLNYSTTLLFHGLRNSGMDESLIETLKKEAVLPFTAKMEEQGQRKKKMRKNNTK